MGGSGVLLRLSIGAWKDQGLTTAHPLQLVGGRLADDHRSGHGGPPGLFGSPPPRVDLALGGDDPQRWAPRPVDGRLGLLVIGVTSVWPGPARCKHLQRVPAYNIFLTPCRRRTPTVKLPIRWQEKGSFELRIADQIGDFPIGGRPSILTVWPGGSTSFSSKTGISPRTPVSPGSKQTPHPGPWGLQ